MAKNFNKINNLNESQDSSKGWELTQEELQEIEDHNSQYVDKIKDIDESDQDRIHDVCWEAFQRVYEDQKSQASSFADAWDSVKYKTIHDKINSGKTTVERLEEKRRLSSSLSTGAKRLPEGKHKIIEESEVKRDIKDKLMAELREQEAYRKDRLKDSGYSDSRYFGTYEWERLARSQRENIKYEILSLKKEHKNPSFFTKVTNLIPFIRNRRDRHFNDRIKHLKSPTEAELKIYNVSPDDDMEEILGLGGNLEYSDWHKKQSRAEKYSVEEDVDKVYESRKDQINKQNRVNEIKNLFESDTSKGIAKYLIDKGVRSEILNNPVFIENIGYLVSNSSDRGGIADILKRVEVDERGDVSFSRSSFTLAEGVFNDYEGVSEKSFLNFSASRSGVVDINEIKAVANIERSPKNKDYLKVENEFSKEHTIYDENGNAVRIERVSKTREDTVRQQKGNFPGLNGRVELLWENTISSFLKDTGYNNLKITFLAREGDETVLSYMESGSNKGWGSTIVHTNRESKFSLDDPSVKHSLKQLKNNYSK